MQGILVYIALICNCYASVYEIMINRRAQTWADQENSDRGDSDKSNCFSVRTSISKETYGRVIFQGGGVSGPLPPPSESAHDTILWYILMNPTKIEDLLV